MKDITHFCFLHNSHLQKNKVWKTENVESFLEKEEEEEVQKYCKHSSNASQGLAFIDSACLVKKTIGRVITLRKN